MTPPSLPVELLSLICDKLSDSPTALARLCCVAHIFQTLVQEHLFRVVDLRGRGFRVVRLWCAVVTRRRQSSPLGLFVRSLSLELPNCKSLAPDDIGRVVAALHRCTNLKTLRVFKEENDEPYAEDATVWILEDCPFRLRRFQNAYFAPDGLLSFSEKQSDIEIFCGKRPSSTTPGLLPRLIGVDTWRPGDALPQHIERLQLLHPTGVGQLSAYSATLTTLNLVNPGGGLQQTPYQCLSEVVSCLPSLLHFAIVQSRVDFWRRYPDEAPHALLPRFKRLRTFTLVARNVVHFFIDVGASARREYIPETVADMRELAELAIEACSSLNRVMLGIEDRKRVQHVYTATRSASGSEGTCVTSVQQRIDFERMSMFWAQV